MMGSANINSESSVQRVAAIIAALVVDIEDVILTASSPKSLIDPICTELRIKPRKDVILKLQRLWKSNRHGIREQVQSRLNQRFDKIVQAHPHVSNDAIVSELDVSPQEDINKDREYSIVEPEDVEMVDCSHSPSALTEIPTWVTPKSSKRLSNDNLKNATNFVIDDESSRESHRSIGDSSCNLDESVSEYVMPSQSPSIRKKFTTSLGKIQVPSMQLLNVDGVVDYNKVRFAISRCMLHDLHFHCPLSFYGGIRPNVEFLVTYARCRYASHVQSFRFDITDYMTPYSSIYVSATECGEIHHEGPKIHCTLKGEARINVKNQLQHIAPRMLQLETVKKIDMEIAEDGHMQELMRLSTYQKAKSEESCKNDTILRSNDLSDLFQQHVVDAESCDPYIRHTGLPLCAHMYSEEQLNIIDGQDIVVHFDSTGCVVRKPKDVKCKRIMYYAIVVNKNNSIIPIAEMVSSEHDIATIGTFLKKYCYFAIKKNIRWPMFRVVVVDWSWALINAVMSEWNMLSVTDYLKETFDFLIKKTGPRSDLIVVHSCCAHFQKRVSTNVHKKFPKLLHIKNLILECVGLMIHCDTLENLDKVFEQFMTVLLTTNHAQAERGVVELHKLYGQVKKKDDANEILTDVRDIETLPDNDPSGRIFSDSPFYKRYYEKMLNIQNTFIDGVNDNKYYAPGIAEYITESLMPYAPMWSAVILKYAAPNLQRLSNANVECHFNIIKKQVLAGDVNLKIGRFLKKLKDYKSRLCAEAALSTTIKGRRRTMKNFGKRHAKIHDNTSPKKMTLSTPDDIRRHGVDFSDIPNVENHDNKLATEMWMRKKKARYSHMEGRLLGKITKKVKASTFRTSTPKHAITDLDASIENREQSLLNKSDSSTHANALQNGLFMDVNYYMNVQSPESTIGRYSPNTCAPIIGYDEIRLYSSQYQTLQAKQWLDGAVIDAYATGRLDFTKNVAYVPTTYTAYLLGDYSDREKFEGWRMYNISNTFMGTIFMPYLYQNHYCLLVVDIQAKTLMHLDPLASCKRSTSSKRAIAKFTQYIEQCVRIRPNVLCQAKWTEVNCKKNRPMQKDAFNCGLYVLHYLMCLANNMEFDYNFQPDQYRVKVAEDLLISSHDMKDVCQYCFSDRHQDLIMCNTCRRWAHLTCLNRLRNTKRTLEDWNSPSTSYRCALCAHETRQWMRY